MYLGQCLGLIYNKNHCQNIFWCAIHALFMDISDFLFHSLLRLQVCHIQSQSHWFIHQVSRIYFTRYKRCHRWHDDFPFRKTLDKGHLLNLSIFLFECIGYFCIYLFTFLETLFVATGSLAGFLFKQILLVIIRETLKKSLSLNNHLI